MDSLTSQTGCKKNAGWVLPPVLTKTACKTQSSISQVKIGLGSNLDSYLLFLCYFGKRIRKPFWFWLVQVR